MWGKGTFFNFKNDATLESTDANESGGKWVGKYFQREVLLCFYLRHILIIFLHFVGYKMLQ